MPPCASQPTRAVRRSACPQMQTHPLGGETFDLNVSSSADDTPAAQPPPTNVQPATPVTEENIGINDAELCSEGKNYAADIHYFLKSPPQTRSVKSVTKLKKRKTFHQHIVNFIVVDDQSLNVIECPEFRALLLLLCSDLKETMVPHRTKLRELIIQAWRRYFQILKHNLVNAIGHVSFTMDIWSDQNRRSYLALTAHWIAKAEETL
ncbi:hypothetical protein PILCRDRAFT_85650 [Piloderma croceum F 1598]|uniref:Uncharacterized protein n=1 Tax=Piloderma croceum (strain F 1598) TaxID=765440 RepID=A0A0C3GAY3_PILCF|nr:hypothetical protein PILCRDRAFT_85650 [Piloderma croceum F 1598]